VHGQEEDDQSHADVGPHQKLRGAPGVLSRRFGGDSAYRDLGQALALGHADLCESIGLGKLLEFSVDEGHLVLLWGLVVEVVVGEELEELAWLGLFLLVEDVLHAVDFYLLLAFGNGEAGGAV
jgi:hypothetical protein